MLFRSEQILLLRRLWDELEIGPVRLQLNCLGETSERLRHREDLIAFLQAERAELDEDAQRRVETNPLRVLDSKNARTQACLARAPRLLAYLGPESRAHFERVQELLRRQGVSFEINERLVRGIDYYNLTVFEWVTDRLGAQGTICGGGRYDGLFTLLGGKQTPACGFSIGVERVLDLMGEAAAEDPACDVYVMHQGSECFIAALQLAEQIRDLGLDVVLHPGDASMKSQMKRADASGAEYAVIVGADELVESTASVKALRAGSDAAAFARQERVPFGELAERLVAALAANDADSK